MFERSILRPEQPAFLELAYYRREIGARMRLGVDPEDLTVLADREARGLLATVDGDGREILPGVTVCTGGRHTFASQYVGVETADGTIVIASDNLYLYENLEQHVAIAQTFDAESNLRAQDRMWAVASGPELIVPGHDPEVFVRFPRPGLGVARIR